MMWLYVLLALLVVAAVPGTVWLKRAGDQSWREHRVLVLTAPMRDAFLRVQIQLVDQMTPAFQEVGRKMARMQREFERLDLHPWTEQIRRDVADFARVTRTRFDREGDA